MSKNKSNDEIMKLVIAKLDKIDEKVEKVEQNLHSVDKTLVKQEANLAEHMRRTALLEEDLKPIKKHVSMIQGVLKFIGLISLVIGIAVGIAKLLGH